jgi:hypothetical protein
LPLLKSLSWPRSARLTLIAVVCLGTFLALALAPRIPIGPGYHDFADKRKLWGIPNALDVLSNIPFVLVGVWGCVWMLSSRSRRAFLDQRERIPWFIFFAGVALTGAGSWWYHMAPSNTRLPWDLLPMTCSFLSVVAAMYMERISLRAGLAALLPLLLLGMASVVYWEMTALHGRGDYKFYLLVQFFSPVVLALIVALFPPRYTGMRWLAIAFALYVAAKLFEIFDYQIFGWGHVVSGHALKHVTAAVACIWILRMLQVRQPVVRKQSATAAPPLSWAAK